jgi:hypothetical protein
MVLSEHDHLLILSWSTAGGYFTVDARSAPGLMVRRRMTSTLPALFCQTGDLPAVVLDLSTNPASQGPLACVEKRSVEGKVVTIMGHQLARAVDARLPPETSCIYRQEVFLRVGRHAPLVHRTKPKSTGM